MELFDGVPKQPKCRGRSPARPSVWRNDQRGPAHRRCDADRYANGAQVEDVVARIVERRVQALENLEQYRGSTVAVDDHSTESIGGIKTVEALGALKLLSGGSASLAAVDDLHLATGRDLNLVVGQTHNAAVGGDMREQIQGMRESVAVIGQRLVAGKTWLGSEAVNVLQVLCDLIDLLGQMNTGIAAHKHGPSPPPDKAAEFTTHAASAMTLGTLLTPITE